MKQGDEEYRIRSRERLQENAVKKIETTMIGAISSIEKFFPDLIDSEDFLKVRQEILDRGNKQISNLKKELSHYDINWKRYTYRLPIKKV